MPREIYTYSEQETFDLAKNMASDARPRLVVCLKGDLGSGKTVFAKGYARGLGITHTVTSPSFTLIHEYMDGRIPFYHFDIYRISSIEEMYMLGYEEYFYGDGVCLIEWAEKISEIIPEDALWICILREPASRQDTRKILIG